MNRPTGLPAENVVARVIDRTTNSRRRIPKELNSDSFAGSGVMVGLGRLTNGEWNAHG